MTRGDGVTMTDVKAKSPSFSRRKLSAVVRKAITSYYTAEEQQEIAQNAVGAADDLLSHVVPSVPLLSDPGPCCGLSHLFRTRPKASRDIL